MSAVDRHSLHIEDRDYLPAAHCPRQLTKFGSVWKRVPFLTVFLWLGLFIIELFVSIYLCSGHLVFTLDDPYIHLAVADHVLSGGYGVNGSEFSSPSSSIIWPYLMAATEALHLGVFGPLLINAVAASATLIAFLRVLETAGLLDQHERLLSFAIAVLAILAVSAIALPMTGMEHSLHVWAVVVTFGGLSEAARGRSPTFVHFAALVLMPLVRFEGAAFALAAIAGFAVLGRLRFAVSASAVICCALIGYFALMSSHGLPFLPSSVLLKSRIAETAYEGSNAVDSILRNLSASFNSPYGFRLALLGLALACGTWLLRSDRGVFTVCGTVLAAIGAHLAFGQYGWFYRYEVYIIALAALALFYLVAHAKALLSVPRWTAAMLGTVGLIGFGVLPYVIAALETPFAARSIYEQQYQMRFFAQQLYDHPVAVNDLGLVAYKNSNFVLDLWGLGSERVRKAKLAGQYGPQEMAALADEYHICLAMVYDSWFPRGMPDSWEKVAILHTDSVTAADGDVAFYKTPAADAENLRTALENFKRTLPRRVSLEIIEP
jgi:hypothetical protein